MNNDGEISYNRVTYREGQLFAVHDMEDDQRREAWLRRLHLRYLHDTWGIALGFEVDKTNDNMSVRLKPGYAVERLLLRLSPRHPDQAPEQGLSQRLHDPGAERRPRRPTGGARRGLGSNSKSSQEPRYGITRAEYRILPEECVLPLSWSNSTPGERCSCETITRSVPLITNVPFSVINGISPI